MEYTKDDTTKLHYLLKELRHDYEEYRVPYSRAISSPSLLEEPKLEKPEERYKGP